MLDKPTDAMIALALRNLEAGDSRMVKENLICLKFYAEHGRHPNLDELKAIAATLITNRPTYETGCYFCTRCGKVLKIGDPEGPYCPEHAPEAFTLATIAPDPVQSDGEDQPFVDKLLAITSLPGGDGMVRVNAADLHRVLTRLTSLSAPVEGLGE
jgi:hypothetical protein